MNEGSNGPIACAIYFFARTPDTLQWLVATALLSWHSRVSFGCTRRAGSNETHSVSNSATSAAAISPLALVLILIPASLLGGVAVFVKHT
jgi:hypothetical protein